MVDLKPTIIIEKYYKRLTNTNLKKKSHFIKSIAQKTFIKEEALWDDLKRTAVNSPVNTGVSGNASPSPKRVDLMERRIWGFLMWQKAKADKADIDVKLVEEKFNAIIGERQQEMAKLDKDLLLFETESYYNNKTNLEKDVQELLHHLEEEYLKKELLLTMSHLQKAEQAKNKIDISKYLKECQRISQKINALKNDYEKK